MSQQVVYTETRDFIKTFDGIKTVDAFRNQFENWKKEDGFPFPAVFIRMEASNFRDIGGNSGIQMYDLLVTLMIGFEHYQGTDYDKALQLKQNIFKKYHRFQPVSINTIGRFLRNGEELENLEFNNLLIFGQSYLCQNCTDYDAQQETKPVNITIPINRSTITLPLTIS